MKELGKKYDEWIELGISIRNDAEKRLMELLSKHGGEISFEDVDEGVCVTYDGGNHPEYAANPYSCVSAIYIKNGGICLNTEDDDEYRIEHICSVAEIMAVLEMAEFVCE